MARELSLLCELPNKNQFCFGHRSWLVVVPSIVAYACDIRISGSVLVGAVFVQNMEVYNHGLHAAVRAIDLLDRMAHHSVN